MTLPTPPDGLSVVLRPERSDYPWALWVVRQQTAEETERCVVTWRQLSLQQLRQDQT